MMKHKTGCLFAVIAAGLCLATAQNPKVHSSSAEPKSGAKSHEAATKPLTPKSAMPPAHKSSAAVPHTSTSSQKTSAELARLEHQNVKGATPKKPAKAASAPKPAGTPNARGSEINFNYQKPATKN
ncbi:MAG TPA: hypothetical protein VN310_04775 [Candidatus Dormibacteraeota bacterium]|jgi:hypothetical protein|nr:hypothetical protein [Candidatus Dormibacteraeota bacterium]